MDRVRFGRALGYGARHAVKTLAQAVDAATSPDPVATPPSRTAPERSQPSPAASRQSVTGPSYRPEPVRQQLGQPRRSLWSPVKHFSGVLWLQVTGTFFSVFALFMAEGVWQLRGAAHAAPHTPEAQKLYFHAAVFAIFAYFAISSFVRAHRRQRR